MVVQFQSTLPHGSDQISSYTGKNGNISIHAPSRERPYKFLSCLCNILFQSTLPHGSDWFRRPLRWSDRHFNPRSLTGATKFDAHQPATVVFSIHAPSRERLCPKIKETPPLCFQSTLPHGSDIPPATAPAADPIFNPRSLTGATTTHRGGIEVQTISIHAPSRERLAYLPSVLLVAEFQSTLPRGSD